MGRTASRRRLLLAPLTRQPARVRVLCGSAAGWGCAARDAAECRPESFVPQLFDDVGASSSTAARKKPEPLLRTLLAAKRQTLRAQINVLWCEGFTEVRMVAIGKCLVISLL